jgi:sialic acid synthase SpsE
MQVIAEVGTAWLPKKFPLADAIKAALDCGADLVKIQYWQHGEVLAMRRGGAKGLERWNLSAQEVISLASKLALEYGRTVLGCSVFHSDDVFGLEENGAHCASLALIKTATQEYQCAALAEAASELSLQRQIPLYVSIPPDGCLVMGNYSSPLQITWLQCAPRYPACRRHYNGRRQIDMAQVLPGKFGLSDHTVDSNMLTDWVKAEGFKLDCVEKHFCYNEKLRKLVPDGGPWSLSQADFKQYVKVAHGG